MMKLLLFTVACAALASARPSERRDFTVGQQVKASTGQISGHAAPQAPDVSEYLGVPFAKPPTGDSRWLAPQSFTNTAPFNASHFGETCASNGILGDPGITGPAYPHHDQVIFGPQGIELLNNEAQANYPSREDCLTLNIWTKPQTGEQAKAVMVWFYGGGFNFGSNQDPWYNGQYLADKQDVVVVTANYRTNIFGFPGAPGLPRQNVGLLDQRLALEWVRDNIGGFGGDAKRITMFGQSAGSTSVDYYSFAYHDKPDPIINGMIMQSGTIFREMPSSAEDAADTWYKYTQKLDCGGKSDNQTVVLACMRSKSTRQILGAIGGKPGLDQVLKSTQFMPVIDEIVAFSDYEDRARQGRFIKRPLLIGNTDDEAGIAQPVAKSLSGLALPQVVVDLINQAVYSCPTVLRADFQVAQKVATWRYRWFGLAPNTVVSYSPASGAYHESDIPFVFGSTEVHGGANTPDEQALVDYIMRAWVTFAKDPDHGLVEYEWPAYDGKNNVLQLGKVNETGPNPTAATTFDTGCGLVNLPTTTKEIVDEILDKLKALGWPGNDSLLSAL